jgi:hypothetical protein
VLLVHVHESQFEGGPLIFVGEDSHGFSKGFPTDAASAVAPEQQFLDNFAEICVHIALNKFQDDKHKFEVNSSFELKQRVS